MGIGADFKKGFTSPDSTWARKDASDSAERSETSATYFLRASTK